MTEAKRSSAPDRFHRKARSSEAAVPLVLEVSAELRRLERDVQSGLRRARGDLASCLSRVGGLVPRNEPSCDRSLLSASALMHAEWYRLRHRDVVAGRDPVAHYLEEGWRLGLSPSGLFDGPAYLRANPDVSAVGMNPLVHYLRSGAGEGRSLEGPKARLTASTAEGRIAFSEDLRSFDDLLTLARTNPMAFSDRTEKAIRDHVLQRGTKTLFLGSVPPEQGHVGEGDMREQLISGGLNSRMRAVADEVVRTLNHRQIPDSEARVYGHEGITHLASLMVQRYPKFVGTEYAPTPSEQRLIFPVPHNDVCDSYFSDESLDVIFSCDVLEHVYDRDLMLSEAARTLAPGGLFLATFPFDYYSETGWLCAEYVDGALVHYLDEPIYHGNPMDDENGALVFEIPGWDIVTRATAAGFKDAVMRFICDQERGITASSENRRLTPRGVFVLACSK